MTYRSDAEAARAQRDALLHELEEIRARARELGDLKAREDEVKRRLDDLDAQLHTRKRSLLQTVKVASPCNARWEDMTGDDRVRFCGSCEKNVFNVSAMPEDEAEELLAAHADGNICIRFYRRADGTVMSADCPEGARKKRVRRVAIAVGGGIMGAAAAAVSLRMAFPPVVSQGGMAARMGTAEVLPVESAAPVDPPAPPPSAEPKGGWKVVPPATAGVMGKLAAPPSKPPR